jgi:pimeloyl-ACP methyl ester carboxylesterase
MTVQAPPFERHEQRFAKAGPYRTRYIEAGQRDRPTVILVHDGAFGTDAELCWNLVIDALAADYHVLAPELLGWGGTDKVVDFGRSRYHNQAAHLANFCKAVEIDSGSHFVGTSFGGSVVVRSASEGSASPLKMHSVVSISGTGGPFRRPEAVMKLGDYTPSLAAARELSALLVSPDTASEEHIRRRYRNSLVHGHWEALKAGQLRNPAGRAPDSELPRSSDARFPATFSRTGVPVLLIEGTRDPINEPGWSRQLKRLAPLAEVVEIDAGHSPNLNRPSEVAAAIAAFISKSSQSQVLSGSSVGRQDATT